MNYFLKTDLRSSTRWIEPTFNELSADRIQSFVAGKNRTASWIVSHCTAQSRREILVRELLDFIRVNIYGECGVPSEPSYTSLILKWKIPT